MDRMKRLIDAMKRPLSDEIAHYQMK